MSKTVFVTGSSSGIGFNICKKLFKNNFDVILNGNNIDKLKKSSKSLGKSKYYLGDITDLKEVKKIFNAMKKDGIKIDVLICNYGNSNKKNNDTNIHHAFKHNFFSSVNVIQEAITLMNKKVKIICISSICGNEIIQGAPMGYSVAKSALNSFVKIYSNFLGERGSINSISLGNIMFPGSLWKKKLKEEPLKTKKYINSNVPTKKFGQIDDVYQICNYLIKQKNNYVTGSNFIIDGGQTRKF